MKYCTQCKKQYPKYVDDCTKCGMKLIDISYQELFNNNNTEVVEEPEYVQGEVIDMYQVNQDDLRQAGAMQNNMMAQNMQQSAQSQKNNKVQNSKMAKNNKKLKGNQMQQNMQTSQTGQMQQNMQTSQTSQTGQMQQNMQTSQTGQMQQNMQTSQTGQMQQNIQISEEQQNEQYMQTGQIPQNNQVQSNSMNYQSYNQKGNMHKMNDTKRANNVRNKKNFMGVWMKIVSVIIALGALAGSAIMSYTNTKVAEYNDMGNKVIGYSIDWPQFLFYFALYFAACVLLCGFLFGMGEIICLLQKIVNHYDAEK